MIIGLSSCQCQQLSYKGSVQAVNCGCEEKLTLIHHRLMYVSHISSYLWKIYKWHKQLPDMLKQNARQVVELSSTGSVSIHPNIDNNVQSYRMLFAFIASFAVGKQKIRLEYVRHRNFKTKKLNVHTIHVFCQVELICATTNDSTFADQVGHIRHLDCHVYFLQHK